MRKILLFVNPVLQRTRSRRRKIDGVLGALRKSGAAIEILETDKDRGAGARARGAVALGYDAILVCGGDGTLFDIIQGIAGSTIPLGIIPFGTGNVMAQNLHVARDPVEVARSILTSDSIRVPLGKITCCDQSWMFAMSAGMGVHAALMSEARRSGKDTTGKAAYFLAGGRLLLNHPVQPFDLTITTTSGSVIQERVCEVLALRVAELNRWRTGGGLNFPFLRLATVAGASRSRLALASYQALFRGGGARDREQPDDASAIYRDVVRVICRPIPQHTYEPLMAVQADGEVLGASCATIEMAGLDVCLLSAEGSI